MVYPADQQVYELLSNRPTGPHILSHESALKSSVFWDATQIFKPLKTYKPTTWLTPAAFSVLPTCSVNEYVCASGGCVSASLRCDGHDNCLDGSDEVSAPPPAPVPPPPAPFIKTLFSKPAVASYLLKHQRIFPLRVGERVKSFKTCSFLSWQIGCVKECREDEFLCLNRAHCIPRRWRCDEVFDCMDHSDEENCSQGRRHHGRGLDNRTALQCK